MEDALRRIDILADLDLLHGPFRQIGERSFEAIEHVVAGWQQLSGRPGIAHLVRALAKETETATAVMKARAHPIAGGRMPRGDRARQPAASKRPIRANASDDDERLDLELPFVGDVRVETAPAQRIGEHHAAIGGGLVDRHRVGIRDPLADALDARP